MKTDLFNRFSKELLRNRKLFVPFITAGDRGLDFTLRAIHELARMGADAIEIGVPFSDPLVDGKTIQLSYQRALARQTHLQGILAMLKHALVKVKVPIILMGALNPFLQYGLQRLACISKEIGVSGFIIPDLPPEEGVEWVNICRAENLDSIFLTTPNTPQNRLEALARLCSGYIYYVSVTGITGVRKQLPQDLKQGIARIRRSSPLPVLVGFGISTPQQAKAASMMADGVIVGSALVRTLEGNDSNASALKRLCTLSRQMLKSLKNS